MSPFWIRTHAMDPLSITASTITIIGAARAAFQFLQTVIQEVGNDGDINALNADVKALFDELELVDNNCESLSQFQVDPTLRKRIETERRACGVTLDKFKSTVEQVTGRIDDPGVVRRFKVMVVRLLKSPSVERLHRQMAQHQQRLHFYVTLMTEYGPNVPQLIPSRKIDEILKAVQTPRNPPSNRHDSSQTLPAEPQPRRRSTNDLPPRPLSIASDTRPPLRRFNTVPSPFPKDSVDHLRPPGLVYKDRLLSQTLLKGCCLANAISKSGQFVTFIRKDVFSVFDIAGCAPLLICTGKRSKGDYRYGHLEPTMHQHDSRMVPGVSSACISDDYLVIAVEGVCFVFTIWGGRWLSMPSIDTGAIEKVVFSPAGDLLLAITKVRINNESKRRAVLYLTADFTPDLRNPEIAKTVSGRKIAEWPSSCEIVDVVFSDDGRSIAISTGHDSSGYSTIWLLKAGPTNVWARKEGTVQVLDKMDATSPGIKGMSLYSLLFLC